MSPAGPGLRLQLAHGVVVAVAVRDGDGDDPRAIAVPGQAAISLDDALAALHPEERARARTLAPVRRRDWVAGRMALRAALADSGADAVAPVLADDRGAPVLPAGVLGSVSHKRGLAVALAAAGDDHRLGVDVELALGSKLDLAPRILTDDERAAIADLSGDDRARAVALRFAIKEAVYKAVDPYVRRYVGFREVSVWPDATGIARVDVVAGADLPLAIDAAWLILGDLLVCTARARRL